jgi:mannose-6-phosphate isomerase-like protein (cupin superfamily)
MKVGDTVHSVLMLDLMEEDRIVFKKNYFNFIKEFDFNELAKVVDGSECENQFTNFVTPLHILETPIKVRNFEKSFCYKDLPIFLNTQFNKKNLENNLYLFFSFTAGGKSSIHKDTEDVHLIGLYGKTLYIINNKNYILEKGDLLIIPKGVTHRAIGLGPRIVLSFGIYG